MSEANGFPHFLGGQWKLKKKIINRDLALNRDTGGIPINPIFNNLKLKDISAVFSSV
jgi:hypothetical protein